MTLPTERFRSLKNIPNILLSLLDPKTRPKNMKEMRHLVKWALRHYPSDYELDQLPKALPKLFEKEKEGK